MKPFASHGHRLLCASWRQDDADFVIRHGGAIARRSSPGMSAPVCE